MRQLRPGLASIDEFVSSWTRQKQKGYRLAVRWDPAPVALAGYRVMENLCHGRHLYVDDLVSDEASRGRGDGAALLSYLKAAARAEGCKKLVLDSGFSRPLAHRFYYREGLLATALHFTIDIK
jgi:GNAT superfamily N-acetyltransferase